MVGKTLLSKGDLRMSKITMTTPLVEMDGDEMTRILWQMIKAHQPLFCVPPLFVLLHKFHVLWGYINITVVAFFCGCVLIAEVPKN